MADQYTEIMIDAMDRDEFDNRRKAHRSYARPDGVDFRHLNLGTILRGETSIDYPEENFGPSALMGDTRFPEVLASAEEETRLLANFHDHDVDQATADANDNALRDYWRRHNAWTLNWPDRAAFLAFHQRQYDTLTELGRQRVSRDRAERVTAIARLGASEQSPFGTAYPQGDPRQDPAYTAGTFPPWDPRAVHQFPPWDPHALTTLDADGGVHHPELTFGGQGIGQIRSGHFVV